MKTGKYYGKEEKLIKRFNAELRHFERIMKRFHKAIARSEAAFQRAIKLTDFK